MTIRNTLRDHGQRYRPRMACLKKAEKVLLEMQDPKTGVKSQPQRLVITTIPHAITGEDILSWLADRFQVDTQEARNVGSMLVALGYIYPLQDHKRLVIKPDASLYRFQTPYFWPTQQWPVEDTDYAIYLAKRNIRKKGILELHEQEQYNRLHKWMNHKWDFIVMQAKEQYRAAKERKKPDRVVFDCQERAYWVVHRPPPGTVSAMDYGLERRIEPNADETKTPDFYERIMIFTQQSIMRPRVKSSVSIGALVKYCATYNNHDPFLSKCLPSNPWLTDDITYWNLNMTNVAIPTKMRVERWTFSFGELLSDPRGRDDFRLFLKKEFSGENLAFWEVCEDLRWGAAVTMREKAEQIYKTFLARGAPRWINIDGKTMEITVNGLKHPHRYVLDAAQTHIYMLMKKDSYGRYLKSPVFKDTVKKAICPEEQKFTDAQLEQNAKNRRPSLSPIVLRQQEQEQRAKMAANAPVDITQLCRFTTPVPHLAVYSGITDSPPAHTSPSLPFLANTTACPSPISVALDSTSASERRVEASEGEEVENPEARAPISRNVSKSRVPLSLRRLLKRGCTPATMFASLSPKYHSAAGTSTRIKPICPDQPSQAPPRRIGNFFQIKVDIPPECRIYPIESEDEDEENRAASRGGVGAKEIICPWESLTPQNEIGQ
ncbi:regulator of G-protein signaling 9-like isoform X1 [Solea senegalensis]|uniref:Regulator of G-protein signaling 9 n=2 Tax=Solea senegalensis TaxID=28829 RepID=A0AAV6RLX5_SOLSE|nr:regulator of G-protein signaling 9-like isoform X1 [Solea senegalensis]KAG7506511.1 regulator of G-protein signaling 9-like isoform X1 [Solea senegalensis]